LLKKVVAFYNTKIRKIDNKLDEDNDEQLLKYEEEDLDELAENARLEKLERSNNVWKNDPIQQKIKILENRLVSESISNIFLFVRQESKLVEIDSKLHKLFEQ